jgi:uncharacterized membrane protein YebE (DUF533 family)
MSNCLIDINGRSIFAYIGAAIATAVLAYQVYRTYQAAKKVEKNLKEAGDALAKGDTAKACDAYGKTRKSIANLANEAARSGSYSRPGVSATP